jgi:hypothetical protein
MSVRGPFFNDLRDVLADLALPSRIVILGTSIVDT